MNNEARGPDNIFKTPTNGRSSSLLSVDSLVGYDVYNHEGEDLGGIKDMRLDIQTGHIAYVVLSFGGIFGMGEKLFAVPWNALTLDESRKRFILNADKETLKNAPGFDKTDWPDMGERTWGDQIHSYYRTKHYSETLR